MSYGKSSGKGRVTRTGRVLKGRLRIRTPERKTDLGTDVSQGGL